MAQISKGDTFTDGQQVTGARLNQLVDSAVLVVGAITDQTVLPAATVAADDQMILSDTSAATLKKTTVGDILGSSLPVVATTIIGTDITGTTVTTPVIKSSANSDIIVTPFDGVNVTGKPFNSPNGITTTVSAVAHGLPTGAMVQVTASNTAYSGLFKIVAINANEFTYTISPAVPLASGTCSYIRKATQRLAGNQTVSGSLIVAGNEVVEGNLRVVGTLSAEATAPTSGNQLANKTYVDGTSSKTANGWCVLPSGLIMQWGTHLTAMANYSVATVTFPTPFPTACFTVQLTARAVTATGGGASLENGIKLNGVPTTTNFSVYVNWAGSQAGTPIYPTWFAVGY